MLSKLTVTNQIGRILPLLSRAVTRATMPDIPHAEVDYNVVQNNGPGAAQVVPHVSYLEAQTQSGGHTDIFLLPDTLPHSTPLPLR